MNRPATYQAFLSYSSLDRPAVLKVAAELTRRDCRCFVDQWYLAPGRDWVSALEKALAESRSVAVFLGKGEMGRWQQRERSWALDRYDKNPDNFAVVPVLLPGCEPPLGFLKQLTWIDLRDDPADSGQLDRLAAALRGEPVRDEGQRQPRATVCPYRGLLYFREEDAEFFFGRDAYIQRLVDMVEKRNLVAVIGRSGSGKSSVVRAGLVPKLRARHRTSESRMTVWDIVTMVPGENPLHALADVLLPLVEPELKGIELVEKRSSLAKKLREGTTPVWDLVSEALKQQEGTDRLLLVVDQWEELYTQCEDSEARQRFIAELLEATERKQSPLSVVLTVRTDFYVEIQQHRGLLDRLHDGKVDLGPMTRDELRTGIEEPAKAKNVELTFEPGLVDRLLDDAGEEPGRLPLLEFALEGLWKRQDHGQLTHDAYKDLGQLSGAIATRAEDVFRDLTPVEQAAAPALFQRLVHAGSKTEEDTRRRADFSSLDAAAQRVVRKLADRRLLVISRVDLSGSSEQSTETVEVAHEELLRRWSRLGQWVNADRKFLQWRARLAPLIDEHRRDPESVLLRHGALREARQYYPARQAEMEVDERKFVEASVRAERRLKAVISIWIVVTLAVVLGISFGVWWEFQQREATRLLADQLNRTTAPEEHRSLVDNELASDRRSVVPEIYRRVQAKPEGKLGDAVRSELGRQRADCAIALIRLNAVDEARLAFNWRPHGDPEALTQFVFHARERGVTAGQLTQLYELATTAGDVETRFAVLLTLGTPSEPELGLRQRTDLAARLRLADVYVRDPSSAIHSAAGWLLDQWKQPRPRVKPGAPSTDGPDWFVLRLPVDKSKDAQELTFIRIRVSTTPSLRLENKEAGDAEFELALKHEVWLSDREVTVGLYKQFVKEVTPPNSKYRQEYPEEFRKEWKWEGEDSDVSPCPTNPVQKVSWEDAVRFCNWLSWREGRTLCYGCSDAGVWNKVDGATGYRLPTELEWEYACRAGSVTQYGFGSDRSLLEQFAIYEGNSDDATMPVGTMRPNMWGLHDMHGNVWEWCEDRYESQEGTRGRLRGGGYSDAAQNCRSADVGRHSASYTDTWLGFRVAIRLARLRSNGDSR